MKLPVTPTSEQTPGEKWALRLLAFWFGQLEAAIYFTRATADERERLCVLAEAVKPGLMRDSQPVIAWMREIKGQA